MAPTLHGLFCIIFASCYFDFSIAPLPNDQSDLFKATDDEFSLSFDDDLWGPVKYSQPDHYGRHLTEEDAHPIPDFESFPSHPMKNNGLPEPFRKGPSGTSGVAGPYDHTNPNLAGSRGFFRQPRLFNHQINGNFHQGGPEARQNSDSQRSDPIVTYRNEGQNNQFFMTAFEVQSGQNAKEILKNADLILKREMDHKGRELYKTIFKENTRRTRSDTASGSTIVLSKGTSPKISVPVEEYPILLSQYASFPRQLVIRLVHSRFALIHQLAIDKAEVRFANLCFAIQILHGILISQDYGIDQGPTQWFQEIVFGRPDKDRLPLIGTVEIEKLSEEFRQHDIFKDLKDKTLLRLNDGQINKKIASYQNGLNTLFGEDQLYTSKFLTTSDLKSSEFALKLLVYWYENVPGAQKMSWERVHGALKNANKVLETPPKSKKHKAS